MSILRMTEAICADDVDVQHVQHATQCMHQLRCLSAPTSNTGAQTQLLLSIFATVLVGSQEMVRSDSCCI